MERPVKISVKVQRIPGALSRVSIQNFNHLQVYFCGIIPPLTFFDRGAWPQVCNTCTCTQKVSYFHVIPEEGGLSLSTQEKSIMFSGGKKSSFIFRLRCKIIFSGKRNIIFSDNTRKIMFQQDFVVKTIFSGRLEKGNMVFRAVSTPYIWQPFKIEIIYICIYRRFDLLSCAFTASNGFSVLLIQADKVFFGIKKFIASSKFNGTSSSSFHRTFLCRAVVIEKCKRQYTPGYKQQLNLNMKIKLLLTFQCNFLMTLCVIM